MSCQYNGVSFKPSCMYVSNLSYSVVKVPKPKAVLGSGGDGIGKLVCHRTLWTKVFVKKGMERMTGT